MPEDRPGYLLIPESCSICSQPFMRAGMAAMAVLLYLGPDPDPDRGETNPDPPLRAFHPACVQRLQGVLTSALKGGTVVQPAILRRGLPRLVAEFDGDMLPSGLDDDDH